MLWLVGMMGSGKSTVAERLADLHDLDMIDMDALMEQQWGPIDQQWKDGGEAVFRHREAALVEEIARSFAPSVVATGGGAVLSSSSVLTMRSSGFVVWLRTSPNELKTRLAHASRRPILESRSLASIYEERSDLYRAAAHAIVDTDGKSIARVVEEVESQWNR